ncbi:MAG: energy-coupling factor ABC transporter permease [Acidimicrobiia bacterium]|nr:energy-coupling factor ABC transporter permease [Acidimicrobiia bacterium]
MHIPDGFINGATSAGFGVAAAGGVGAALRQTGKYLSDRQVPLAGLVAAFVFAAQMFNFPVISGMSGHLMGGVLAAVLIGPWAGFIVIAVVLLVQGIFFADGGLTALGLNIFNLGFIGALGGYAIYRMLLQALPKNENGVIIAAGLAAGISVPLAALGFVVQFAIGGTVDLSMGTVLTAMLGTHILIGIGEGLITAMVIGAVVRSRPDLVYGAPDYTGVRTEVLA